MRTGEDEREDDRPPETYTVDEVRDGLDALENFEKAKLRKISWGLSAKADMEPDDLYQEAVCRMLSSRSCPNHVPIIAFAAMTMKGIASDAWRARMALAAKGSGTIHYAANDAAEPASTDPTPEEAAIIGEHYRKCLSRLEALIVDDEPLQFLVEGIGEGLRGKELEDFVGTDTRGLATLRKQLTRLRSKAFPKGSLQ